MLTFYLLSLITPLNHKKFEILKTQTHNGPPPPGHNVSPEVGSNRFNIDSMLKNFLPHYTNTVQNIKKSNLLSKKKDFET